MITKKRRALLTGIGIGSVMVIIIAIALRDHEAETEQAPEPPAPEPPIPPPTGPPSPIFTSVGKMLVDGPLLSRQELAKYVIQQYFNTLSKWANFPAMVATQQDFLNFIKGYEVVTDLPTFTGLVINELYSRGMNVDTVTISELSLVMQIYGDYLNPAPYGKISVKRLTDELAEEWIRIRYSNIQQNPLRDFAKDGHWTDFKAAVAYTMSYVPDSSLFLAQRELGKAYLAEGQ